jgi:hypothetical protein
MAFVSETIDNFAHADGQRNLFFNNGTKPLIITNTQGSCGCTVPISKEPISRAKGIIVKYATDRVVH